MKSLKIKENRLILVALLSIFFLGLLLIPSWQGGAHTSRSQTSLTVHREK
jgi:hypothetical protein